MAEIQIYGGETRSWFSAMWRGLRKKCPQCGKGHVFSGYLKTKNQCETCGLDFRGHKADDAPPYFTIMVVGHIVIPLALAHRQLFDPSLLTQFIIWIPVLLISTFDFLPRSKGALIGLQWANRMHGFDRESDHLVDVSQFKPAPGEPSS